MNEAKRIFGGSPPLTQTEQDANLIMQTAVEKNIEKITLRQLSKMVLVRQKDRRNNAIHWLEACKKIDTTNNGTSVVIIFKAQVKNENATLC